MKILTDEEVKEMQQTHTKVVREINPQQKKSQGKEAIKIINTLQREAFCGHTVEMGSFWWLVKSKKITLTICEKCAKELGIDMGAEHFIDALNYPWNRKKGILVEV